MAHGTKPTLKEILGEVPVEERVRRMSPENRALFERIMRRRQRIGPVGFDIVEAIREMREGD